MSRHSPVAFWTGFAVVLALLIVAPLVLPEFWRRFVTEILIWGLLAMSSDILIGYTGMVSFGHSAFFGLGMYGAAAALLTPFKVPRYLEAMAELPHTPTGRIAKHELPRDRTDAEVDFDPRVRRAG